MSIEEPIADEGTVFNFINTITECWFINNNEESAFEIRCIGENKKPFIRLFTPKDKDKAVDLIVKKNQEFFNIYMTINPIDPKYKFVKAAKDENISHAHFCFADADDQKGVEGLTDISQKKPPDITVFTGTIPHNRQHCYWRLTLPCTDMAKWKSYQKRIAESFGTDPSIVNPSRIMRVAGTVSYPNPKKVLRGYKPELVTMIKGASHGSK